MAGTVPDRSVLAGRIQGFGNVNPPPIEDETGGTIAKRAISRLGDMVGEEVMLTVEDFREKGAVGAVKDAVADAGDILIDGVAGLIGWIRGDPPPEEDNEKAEDATKALSNGPAGAAYGISQASPTGGINAVWVMPEEADPAALAQLATQQGGLVPQGNDPRVPKNIQPYQPPPGRGPAPVTQSFPMGMPGGPVIAPYQPAPSAPGGRPPPFVPGPSPAFGGFQPTPGPAGRWGPGGYNPASGASSMPSSASAPASGAKGLVERIAKGEVLIGPDVVKRLVSQCQAAKTTGKQLGEIVCERARRLYLGLDGGDPAESDAALARMLGLADALHAQTSLDPLIKVAVEDIKQGVSEELLSMRSSAKHKVEAEQMLRRLGMISQAQDVDLLGGGGGGVSAATSSAPAGAAAEADLLGGATTAPARSAATEADLLGGEASATTTADLLGGVSLSSAPPAASSGIAALDPLLGSPGPLAPSSGGSILAGLSLDIAPPVAGGPLGMPGAAGASLGAGPKMGTLAAGATLAPTEKKDEDAFGFVGAEMSKAKDSRKP